MKNTLIILTISLLTITGCKRKDYYIEKPSDGPVITLNGNQETDINFGDTYTDPGATAVDAKGNPLIVIVNQNGFTTSKAKTHTIDYTATDGNGVSVTVSRTVNVILQSANLIGDYSVQSDCKYSIPQVPLPVNFFKGSANVVAGPTNNQLEFKDIAFAGGNDSFIATVNNKDITVAGELTISPVGVPTPFTYEFNGTGTISEDGRVITVNYIWENITPIIGGGISSCIAVYTKNG